MTRPDTSLGAPVGLRARRRNATRAEIRQAALTLFEQHGVERTTVDEIAHAAGIAPRTFFRYFTSKEECVLFDLYGFDEALRECLTTTNLASLTLADVETAFGRVIEGIGNDEHSEVAATTLRIQKLVFTDPALSRAAVGHHADSATCSMALLDDRCSPSDRARVRMILQIAQVALQLAFEEWVEACSPSSADSDLSTIYRDVCARVRTL